MEKVEKYFLQQNFTHKFLPNYPFPARNNLRTCDCCQAISTFLSLHTTQKYGNKTTYLLSSILSDYFAEAGILLAEITLEALSYMFILIPHP